MMKAGLLLTVLLGFSTLVQGAQTLSVEDWGRQFSQSLDAKQSQKALALLDFKKLETQVTTCVNCELKKKIREARERFAKGQFDQALSLYNQIPKGADYWFEAIQEKGWSYFRKNDAEKAIAQTKTLLSPQFSEVVSAEAYFLQALSQLKICDYKGIFETTQLFKEKQKARILSVQKMTTEGFNNAFLNSLKTVKTFPLKASELGDSLTATPVLYYKDVDLQKAILRFKFSQKALEVLRLRQTQATLQTQLDKINQEAFAQMKERLKVLAQQENEDNSKILTKLNLVEVEAIQRIHSDMSLDQNMFSKGEFKDTHEDQLIFMDDGRPWIDELDKYDVAAKACPQNIRRKM